MNRYYPTLKDIIYTALSVIHNHPDIQTPIIQSPVPDINGNLLTIPIDRYRNYDGIELLEPGLTLSIFPRYAPAEKAYGPRLASEFTATTIGDKGRGFMYEATYYLVVQLAYQDVALNQNKQLVYVKDKFDNVSSIDRTTMKESTNDPFPVSNVLSLEVNPAEDILRDYLELIRIILEQIDYYVPWSIRGTSVTGIGFPTTSWSQESKQVYFHQAYLNWELYTYAPSTYIQPSLIKNLTISSINNATSLIENIDVTSNE